MTSQPVILDAAFEAAHAASVLASQAAGRWVVVRRQVGHSLAFYLFTVEELCGRLDGAEGPLAEALALDGCEPAALMPAEEPGWLKLGAPPAVMLDGDWQVVGVLEAAVSDPLETGHRGDPSLFRESRAGRGEVYPALSAPDSVRPGEAFSLEIGLAPTPRGNVAGDVLLAADDGAEEVELGIMVVADGFDALKGWRHTLRARRNDLFAAAVSVPLVARGDGDESRLSLLIVHFSCGGAPCGVASRRIVVAAKPVAQSNGGGVPWVAWQGRCPAAMRIAAGRPADLTLHIDQPDGDQATGRYVVWFESPHPVAPPAAPLPVNLGVDAATFARQVIRGVGAHVEGPLLAAELRGVGQDIARKLPPETWSVLRAVWEHVRAGDPRAVPTVLLMSAEPHVPWELAYLREAPDPSRPPFLAAQVAFARWIAASSEVPATPAEALSVRRMAVVGGTYERRTELPALPAVAGEVKGLTTRYGAVAVHSSARKVDQLLNGEDFMTGDGVQVIHFAGHGSIDPANPRDGEFVLEDGTPLDPRIVGASLVAREQNPFLFLNACQVGHAGEILGEYGGFAGQALRAGFTGFVAPLWSVRDTEARTVALDFYRRAFEDTPVSHILRDIRGRYQVGGEEAPPATYLAYVYYGNPHLLLTRSSPT